MVGSQGIFVEMQRWTEWDEAVIITATVHLVLGVPMRVRYIPFLAVFALTGCSKIHQQFSFSIEPGESHVLNVSAPLSEQKLKVNMTSDQPVNIYIILDKNVPEGKDDFDPETLKEGVLAKEKGKKDADLSVTIPAKEKFRVFVNGAVKKASVTVKIDSQ